MNLRREAIGRVCQIRLPGCTCEPCCLCHWRQLDFAGMGQKSPDVFGAWGCHHCHSIVDTHKGDPEIQLDFAKAVFRTQNILLREGKISWA